MGQGPFAKRSSAVNPGAERRQSSHLAYAAPVVISGRDVIGQLFREVTETFNVSLHGAAIYSRKQIPLGTQLTIECVATGTVAKCICVRVKEAGPGEDRGAIGVQLIVPANLWGVRNPPSDWLTPAKRFAQAERSFPPPAVTPAPSMPSIQPQAEPGPDLEQRSAELAESVLKMLRSQAAGILRESLQAFEERLKFLESGIEAQIIQHAGKAINDAEARVMSTAEKTVEETELELARLRRELLEQMSARTERAILNAEITLREKLDRLIEEHEKKSSPNPEHPVESKIEN